jgi:SAM-dependent methyltransferase
MPVERERVDFAGHPPPWIRHEHLARYLFASERVDGEVVVDCACGDGTGARLLATRAVEVHAFDLSEHTLQQARDLHSAPNLRFEVADATALPISDRSADAYVSLETIEHLPDQEAFLDEVLRVLKPSGEFICSTPDRDVYSPGNTLDSRSWNRFHVREYSQLEFTALLGRYFGRVDVYGQNPKSPTLVRTLCAIGRWTPGHFVVRLNQAMKVPRYLHDRLEKHTVMLTSPNRRYELLTAVCSLPGVPVRG